MNEIILIYQNFEELTPALSEFTAKLTHELFKRGMYVLVSEVLYAKGGFGKLISDHHEKLAPAVVVNQTGSPEISRIYARRGVPHFNECAMAPFKNDKLRSFTTAWSLDIPVLNTERLTDAIAGFGGAVGYPCVIKRRRGHNPDGVRLIHNYDEFLSSVRDIEAIGANPDDYIVQEAVSGGEEMRVFIVDGKIVSAVDRTCSYDFRSSISEEEGLVEIPLDELPEEVVESCNKIATSVPVGFSGLDFLYTGKTWVLNEIHGGASSPLPGDVMNTTVIAVADYIERLARQPRD